MATWVIRDVRNCESFVQQLLCCYGVAMVLNLPRCQLSTIAIPS